MSVRKSIGAAIAALGVTAPMQAQTIQSAAGTAYYAPSIGNFSTLGNNLFGMLVTGRFSDGQVYSANWGALSGAQTGVSFAGRFSLTLGANTNTFGNPFSLTVFGAGNTLQSLTLSGASGPVVFDRSFGGAQGTVTSATGTDLAYYQSDNWTTLATYRNAVQLVGSSGPVGDLWETLILDFRTGLNGTNAGRLIRFSQDVDNVIDNGLLMPVPEPEMLLLTAVGLSMTFLVVRRRRRVEAMRAR
ncbi:MAG: PEP-CTERM sorting domain-containing protein [Gemmatimonadaceae bacterium]|nr:PEP-CTERM sorting domain-containing protein [Gemmatimonadaceae bacterium]